ncbi:MAG: hypothetical protein A2158_05725 [Chloroflexi bacterium RBG_13_46_14]|nr:MAG: hypothetical protein A2158_05725 [Chloroflexi bacterium RBG_13_46_14]
MRIKGIIKPGMVSIMFLAAFTCSVSAVMTSANGYTAASIQMSATINGLAQGETATLLIGTETPDLDIQNALFEYQINGTGESVQTDMAPVLEDGLYLLLLKAPDHYFREPKGYSFSVHDSVIVNPTSKTITFDLKPLPAYPASEAVIDLSGPPKQPIPLTIPPTVTIEQTHPWQVWLVTVVMAIVAIALVVVLVLWWRRLRFDRKT